MNKIASLLLSLIFVALSASAENYPYRADDLWLCVPDHADWIYSCGENPEIEVTYLKYGVPQDVEVFYEIGGDMMPAEKNGSVKLKNGRAKIKVGTMKQPGFRDLRLRTKKDGKMQHHCKVGFSPEKIAPVTQKPADFDAFWEANMAELAQVPLSYEMTFMPDMSDDKVEYYLVKLRTSKENHHIFGYLSKPKGAQPGSCPVVLCPPGAGIKTIKEPTGKRYYAENSFMRLEIEIHGLDPRLSDDTFKDISRAFGSKANNYLNNGLDNKDRYYMKNVYLGCVRAIDFLTSLPEWDGRNVCVQGGSQGGALALITAGLDSRVTACVANHPALSDMAGYKADRAGGYPHYVRDEAMYTPEKIATMAYYDVINFARRIQAPVRMTWGYNDDVCPPTTSYAVFNTLTSPKEALLTPINEHWTTVATERSHMSWLLSRLR